MDVDVNPPTEGNSQQEFSTDLLRVYYGRLFPYEAMFNWLSYGNDPSHDSIHSDADFFLRREFSFTMEDDLYIRYQCFRDCAEMTTAIQKRQPHKIDIGAVFTDAPKDHKTVKPETFKPVERELVFDIDMTDYDDIRTCCTGANICLKCWPYMTMAIQVMDEALREDFAYKNILWVYSGRRGVHCWVCDAEARSLSNEARSAVVEYLSVAVGSAEKSDKKIRDTFKQPFHPMIRRAYDTLVPYFEKYIADGQGQGLLEKRAKYIKVLNSLPNEQIRLELASSWEENEMDGAQRWRELVDKTTPPQRSKNASEQSLKKRKVDYAELESWRVELVFTHCYPRLDANVSKAQNHLLKSPFCIHPKTGRVCVPIDPASADQFNPFSVPTVRSLCAQIDAYDRTANDTSEVTDIEKTDMREALSVFNKTFMSKLASSIKRNLRDRQERVAAITGDFQTLSCSILMKIKTCGLVRSV